VPGTWRGVEIPRGDKLSTVIPGGKRTRPRRPNNTIVAKEGSTNSFCPLAGHVFSHFQFQN